MDITQDIIDAIRPIHRRSPYKFHYFLRDLGLVYLAIPKNANSFLRHALFAHSKMTADFRPAEESVAAYMNRTPSRRLKVRRRRALSNPHYCRLVVLRNPLERLVSAYLEKFVRPGPDGMADKYRGIVARAARALDRNITPETFTFEDFLRHAATCDDMELNPHWRPQQHYVADTTFDFHGDVADLEATRAFLLGRLGIDIGATGGDRRTNALRYAGGASDGMDAGRLTPTDLRAMEAYPAAASFYAPPLLECFLQRYEPDLHLYATRLGYTREALLAPFRAGGPAMNPRGTIRNTGR